MTQGWNHVKNVLNEKNTIYKIMNDLKFFICAIHKTSISRRLALPGYPAITTTTTITTTTQGAKLVIMSRSSHTMIFVCNFWAMTTQKPNES
jgi:hypothetical protein